MSKKHILAIVFLFIGQWIMAQHDHDHDHEHEHQGHNHKNEIGIANAPVYFLKEKEFAYGLHVHFIRQLNESNFGIGLGYERIFDEHKHNTIGVVGSFRHRDALVINLAPGITFEESIQNDINFAIHLEATYEWEFNNVHIGPVVELAYDPEDIHFSLGLHLGLGF